MRRPRRDALDADPMMVSEEVAALFRVNAKTVDRWAESRVIAAIKTPGGGKWLFRESEVRRHLEGGES